MTVLLSGFEPFDGATTNPSWLAVSALRDAWTGDEPLVAVELPCTFDGAWPALRAAIERHEPRVVIAVGLAGGTAAVRLERVAINVIDARIPDNAGSAPVDVPVVADGPAAWFTGLPLKPSLVAVREAGVPVAVSSTAGTYVCNATFYALMQGVSGQEGVRAGFVHVPDVESLPLAATVEALRVVVETACADLDGALGAGGDAARVSAGAEH
ncbi:pyroglutamyl-peptidase I [Oerskovia sp. NPDC060338]|uniref:pyroglutamyl-peptidase I family protein n=1 Tax=unclassified Oerskovia TaxID=2619021 RepID=UPI00365937AA